MGRKFTVMGFTEAELGFVLAAFFAAVSVAHQSDRLAAEDRVRQIATRPDSTAAIAAQRDSAQQQLAMLRDSIRRKSNLPAPCTEKGEPDTPIAELRVLGSNRYAMDGVDVSFDQVLARLGGPIARQKEKECRYSIRVIPVEGVDAPMYSLATRKLRNVFYLRER